MFCDVKIDGYDNLDDMQIDESGVPGLVMYAALNDGESIFDVSVDGQTFSGLVTSLVGTRYESSAFDVNPMRLFVYEMDGPRACRMARCLRELVREYNVDMLDIPEWLA